jgi:hypothetical protein
MHQKSERCSKRELDTLAPLVLSGLLNSSANTVGGPEYIKRWSEATLATPSLPLRLSSFP